MGIQAGGAASAKACSERGGLPHSKNRQKAGVAGSEWEGREWKRWAQMQVRGRV